MTQTPNLAIAHIAAAQSQKEVTANEAFDRLDRALTDRLEVDLASGNVALPDAQFRQHLSFQASGLTEDRGLTVSTLRDPFVVLNPSADHTVDVTRGATVVAVGPASAFILYADGTSNGLHAVGAGAGARGSAYDFGFVKADTPVAGGVMGKVVLRRALTRPAGFEGAAGHVDTPPDDPFAIDVTVDALSIGTITVAATGALSFATTGSEAKAIAAGGVVRFVAPGTADASIAGLAVTLAAALA